MPGSPQSGHLSDCGDKGELGPQRIGKPAQPPRVFFIEGGGGAAPALSGAGLSDFVLLRQPCGDDG
jgi:hypothetical protein